MKLDTYISKLQKLAKKHPDLEVIYSKDEEGNAFEPVLFEPAAGYFNGCDFDTDAKGNEINAICIN